MQRNFRPVKEINLWRMLAVVVPLAAGIYLVSCWVTDAGWASAKAAYVLGLIVIIIVTAYLGIQIRLGRLPWFEPKDGKKQRFVVWLEAKLPFLRADFHKK